MLPSSPTAGARAPKSVLDEEDELDLPPLDGTLDEASAQGEIEADDFAREEDEARGDDSAASDLDPGFDLAVSDAPVAEGSEPAKDAIDVGAIAFASVFQDAGERGSDDRGLARDHEDEAIFDGDASDDAEAGTGEDPASFVDEGALPPLDADAGDEAPGGEIEIAGASAVAAADRGPWRAVSGIGARVPCWLVAASEAHVVAAGPTVLVAREGGRVSGAAVPDIDAVALAAADDAIFAVTRRGALHASVDGGVSWASGSVPWAAAPGALAIAATPGRLWICDGGALWSVRFQRRGSSEAPRMLRKDGVRAMVAAGLTLITLVEREGEIAALRFRADDEAPPAQALPASLRAAIGDARPALAASATGRSLAVVAGGAAHVSRDGGRSFRRLRSGPVLAAAFAGEGDDAPVVVLSTSEERGRASDLVLAEAGDSGPPAAIAELPEGAANGRAALVWDAARDLLWVASGAGLLAFERSARH